MNQIKTLCWIVHVTFILTSWRCNFDTRYIQETFLCRVSSVTLLNIFLVKYIFRVIDLHFFWPRNVHITQIFCEINPKNKLLESHDAISLFLSTELSMKDGEYQMTEKRKKTYFFWTLNFFCNFSISIIVLTSSLLLLAICSFVQ